MILHIKMSRSDEIDNALDGFDVLPYDRWKQYRVRLREIDLNNQQTIDCLKTLTQLAKNEYLN